MRYFRRQARSDVRVKLDSQEADLMRRLVAEMRSLLQEETREDPAFARLFPDAYESPEDARAFRELVGDELQMEKLRTLDAMEGTLGKKGAVDETLAREQAQAWLTALTDMRLTLGTRLEVSEETMAADIDPDDPNAPMLAVLHWLGWLQESLLKAIEGD